MDESGKLERRNTIETPLLLLTAGRKGFRSSIAADLRPAFRLSEMPRAVEVREEVRRNFELARGVSDLEKVKFLLSDGRQRLKQLQDMLGLQR